MNAQTLDLIALLTAVPGTALSVIAWQRARRDRQHEPAQEGAGASVLRRWARPLAQRLRPTSQSDLERLTTLLQRAGRRHRDDADRFLEEKVLALGIGLTSGVVLALGCGKGVGLVLFLACVALGLFVPEKLLAGRGAERQARVAASMPSAVDLLVTCLDAGLSLEQAISRVARDVAHSDPTLAEELLLTSQELDAGVALPDALRRLSRRVGLDDLSAMCGVVAQAHALGAPIAQTLRDYAMATRRQRMAVLEERAGKLGAQLTMPLALCLLPAAMLLILGPAALQLARALAQ
jgi:tight adherence protein C